MIEIEEDDWEGAVTYGPNNPIPGISNEATTMVTKCDDCGAYGEMVIQLVFGHVSTRLGTECPQGCGGIAWTIGRWGNVKVGDVLETVLTEVTDAERAEIAKALELLHGQPTITVDEIADAIATVSPAIAAKFRERLLSPSFRKVSGTVLLTFVLGIFANVASDEIERFLHPTSSQVPPAPVPSRPAPPVPQAPPATPTPTEPPAPPTPGMVNL